MPRYARPFRLEATRVVVNGMSWRDYVIRGDPLDVPGLRMTSLEGELELHKAAKERGAEPVECWVVGHHAAARAYRDSLHAEARSPSEEVPLWSATVTRRNEAARLGGT